MDATIKGKLSFYNQQNQMLANSANDAVNYYNTIIKTQFDNKFWIGAGLAGGASALLAKAMVPTVTISPLPEMIATAASTELATVGGSTALATTAATTTAAATSTELALSGVITTAEGVEVLTGAANAAALSGAVEVGSGTAAGATAAGGGAAISVALPYIIAGIAVYIAGKAIGEVGGQYYCYKKGKEQLEELVRDVTLLRSYCKVMSSQISTALSSLSSASVYISVAEKKIVDQEYKTKYKNLQSIRERQAEVQSLANCLKTTQKVVDIIFNNLSAVA